MQNELPYWLFITLETAKALLTPVVAIFGLWIAINQLRVSKSKLRLDLYERRYKIYEAIRSVLGKILREGPDNALKNYVLVHEFDVGTADSSFLFDQAVTDHLAKMRKKLIELAYLSQENRRQSEKVGGKPDFDKEYEQLNDLVEELTTHGQKFERFLKVDA